MPHAFFRLCQLVVRHADVPLSGIPFQGIVDRVASGAYKVRPASIFAFEHIREAHRLIESNEANGKIVVQG